MGNNALKKYFLPLLIIFVGILIPRAFTHAALIGLDGNPITSYAHAPSSPLNLHKYASFDKLPVPYSTDYAKDCPNGEVCKSVSAATTQLNTAIQNYNAFVGEYNRLYDKNPNDARLKTMQQYADAAYNHLYYAGDELYNYAYYVYYLNNGYANNAEYIQKRDAALANFNTHVKGVSTQASLGLVVINTTLDTANTNGQAVEAMSCSFNDYKGCINIVIKWASYYTLTAAAWLLGFAGLILNEVIVRTVIGMKTAFDSIPAINSGWLLIRSIGNWFFVAILLYIIITTILGLSNGNTKRMIRNVIIVGLLVNFSLFFTKVLIDASNITTIYFHDAITVDKSQVNQGTLDVVSGFSGKFATALGITSLYNPNSDDFASSVGGDPVKMIITGIGGAIFLTVTSFAFLLAAVLLIIRFVVLIILLILSPVAYFGFILPSTVQYAKRWWNMLAAQLTFAPVFMIMMFLILTLAQTFSIAGRTGNDGLKGALSLNSTTAKEAAIQTANAAKSTALAGNIHAPGPLSVVFNFVIIIGFMIFAIIISSTIASNTGGFVGSVVKRTRSNMVGAGKWLGRKGYGAASTATVGAARKTANISGAAVGNTATWAMNTRAGQVVRDKTFEYKTRASITQDSLAQKIPLSATRRGAKALDRLNGAEGDALRERVKGGDAWAQAKLTRLEEKSKNYKERLENQKTNLNKIADRTGTVSTATQTNIDTTKKEVSQAEKAYRAAMALPLNHPNRDKFIKRAEDNLKAKNEELDVHKTKATLEVKEQRTQFVAQMGSKKGRAYQDFSKTFLSNARNTKKTPDEKASEQIYDINSKINNPTELETTISKIRPENLKDLPGSVIQKPEVLNAIWAKHGRRGFVSLLKNVNKYSPGEASKIVDHVMDPTRRNSIELGDFMELQKSNVLEKISPADQQKLIRYMQSYNVPGNATATNGSREKNFYEYLNNKGRDYWK